MLVFCFLWTPLCYLFWRSLNDESELGGGTWALILGTITAVILFFLGDFINPEGFGLSRWVSGCIDIVVLPAVLPFIISLVFIILRLIPPEGNFTNYAFLWLIPTAFFRALGWSSQNNIILLMAVPVLWTAIVIGIGFFIRLIQSQGGWIIAPAILGTLALPLAGVTAYWTLFAQNNVLGIFLLVICLVPMIFSFIFSFLNNRM